MKHLLLFMMIITLAFSSSVEEKKPLIQVNDTSGLSDSEVREIAEKIDKEEKPEVSLKDIYEVTDANGSVDVAKLQALWEDLTPKTDGFDWIKTKKGEWFKGEVKAMFDDRVEFDSEEMGIHTFDLDDVAYIKTHNPISINIEGVASVSGIIRLDEEKIKIIQGNTDYEFDREQIVSFAPAGEKERNLWSGKVTLSIDKREGNKEQFDYSAQVNLNRRTDSTRLALNYLGRISTVDGTETSNDHRVTETYDVYLTRRFFWTPLSSEYYTDTFQNIDRQITASVGMGYTLIDKKKFTWDVSSGPGVIYTKYNEVEVGEKIDVVSPSFETRTKVDYEINKKSDIIFDFKFSLTDKDSGAYKHHMILTLENELTSWLDFDISYIWDHVAKPTNETDGTTPFKNDYQLLMGLGIDF